MKPMNYQQALASGATMFYYRIPLSLTWQFTKEPLSEFQRFNAQVGMVSFRDCEFLPIPTADQLLGAVERTVWRYSSTPGETATAVFAGELNPGDQVIIMRTPAPIEPGKLTQEGEK